MLLCFLVLFCPDFPRSRALVCSCVRIVRVCLWSWYVVRIFVVVSMWSLCGQRCLPNFAVNASREAFVLLRLLRRLSSGFAGKNLHRIVKEKSSHFSSSRAFAASIRIAPSGAVMRMPRTATDRMMFPHGSPMESGTAPMAACTVALGR